MKFIVGKKKTEINGTTALSMPKKALIAKIQINILMDVTIQGSIMIQFPKVTQHHCFSRKINRKIMIFEKA
jgi:hypothetical protein